MTNIRKPNTPQPNGTNPSRENKSAGEEKFAGGTHSPQKRGPAPMHEDDMKHKRGGGDVERESPGKDDEGDTRHGGRSDADMDEEETGGHSRPGHGRSRNT